MTPKEIPDGPDDSGPIEEMSRNEAAYTLLKQALVTLTYKPGEYLNIAQVMERFKLGRTPVNQALHRLSAEGLVQVIPRKGAVAAPLSINDALELIEVRLVNETLCMQLAARFISADELAELKRIAEAFEHASERNDALALTNTDRLFHEKLAEASRNTTLKDILDVLHARSQRFWSLSLSAPGHIQDVALEHRAILQALIEHDADAASQAATAHILSFKASLLSQSR